MHSRPNVPAASALAVGLCCKSKDLTAPDSTWKWPRGHPGQ